MSLTNELERIIKSNNEVFNYLLGGSNYNARKVSYAVSDGDKYYVRDVILSIANDYSDWAKERAYYLAEELCEYYWRH